MAFLQISRITILSFFLCIVCGITSQAADYYLLMFSTENCQYCDLAEKDFKEYPNILNKFNAAIKIKADYKRITNTNKEITIQENLKISSLKDETFLKKLFEYTSEKTLLKAAANADRFPTFTIVSIDKNGTLIGVGSLVGYPGQDKFISNTNNIISNDNKALFKRRFPFNH